MQKNLIIGIAGIIAFVVACLIWIPLLLYVERLELSGSFKPPNWMVMPSVILVVGSFFSLWKLFLILLSRRKE
jgi:uncharacterized BrkB/YihY/UPF0761 family membrane protein